MRPEAEALRTELTTVTEEADFKENMLVAVKALRTESVLKRCLRHFLYKVILVAMMCGITAITCCGCALYRETAKQRRGNLKIVATSPAVTDIMARLDVDLIGVPNSTLSVIPKRYDDVKRVGTAMGPDMEIIKSLKPDYVICPAALQSDMEPKLEAAGLTGIFLNLESVEGMYKSIRELGELLGREEAADTLVDEFSRFYSLYTDDNAGDAHPRVLILMGLPGSYVVATGKSYAGSLVRLAGGENVYEDEEVNYIVANPEDMLKRQPDIILRAAHAMPEDVLVMFREEFETDDIWKHFQAVKDDRVYDLPYELVGMSAKFNYPEALEYIRTLYKNTKETG